MVPVETRTLVKSKLEERWSVATTCRTIYIFGDLMSIYSAKSADYIYLFQTHKIELISVGQARKGSSAISSLLCYSSLISCYKCKYQWIVNIITLINWVDSKWWCLFLKWSVWTECSSMLFLLLLTVFTHVDRLMCDWWMKKWKQQLTVSGEKHVCSAASFFKHSD